MKKIKFIRPMRTKTCIHKNMHTQKHAYTKTCIHKNMHTQKHAYTKTCIHKNMHTFMQMEKLLF